MKHFKLRISIIFILVLSFIAITFLMRNYKLENIENYIYESLASFIDPLWTRIMKTISGIGSFVVITVTVLFLFLLPYTRIQFGIPLAINAILTAGLNLILKNIIARDRPNILRLIEATGYGFPSGHAMFNTAFYTLLSLIIFRETKNRKTRFFVIAISLLITFLVGISRVYLGVHISGDIIAGWIMGASVALFVDTIWQLVLKA